MNRIPACLASSDRRQLAVHLFALLLWPFLFLAQHVRGKATISNDITSLYYPYKPYLLGAMAQGRFPLWSPTEEGGYPFYCNPFAQAVYPLNAPLLLWYRLAGGLTFWDYEMYAILGLSIYGLGLYLWLRSLALPSRTALAATMIAVVSLKLTELLRFPNALHSAAWMPWMLWGATRAAQRRHLLSGALVFSAALLMILTAGYPYYIVYTPFLLVPYVLALLIPPLRRVWLATPDQEATRSSVLLGTLLVAASVSTALVSPWLLKMRGLMSQTVDRGTPNFEYATGHAFDSQDSLGSWIFPPASQFEGWYYFGMFTTLAVGCYLLDGALRLGTDRRDRYLQVCLLSFLAVVSYFTWGRQSALFVFVWHHTPVLNQLRVWGRMNIILVPAIALLLALALEHLRQLLPLWHDPRVASQRRWRLSLSLQVVLCAAILCLQIRMALLHEVDNYWVTYFHPVDLGFFAWMTLVAAVVLAALVWLARRLKPAHFGATLLTAAVTVSCGDLYILSSRQWTDWNTPPLAEERLPFDVLGSLEAQFTRPRNLAVPTPMSRERPNSNLSFYENWGFKRYADEYFKYFHLHGKPRSDVDPQTLAAATRFFGADHRAERVFLSRSIDHSEPVGFLADVDATAARAHSSYEVLAFDGDRLRLRVQARQPLWVSYIDNWDPDWQAKVNGQRVHIVRLFGSFKSVLVPVGQSEIVFTYRPW